MVRAYSSTLPRRKGHEHENNDPATDETWGIAKTDGISIIEPDADQTKAPESKPGPKPNAKDDLRSLALPEPSIGRGATNAGKPA